MAQKRNPHDTLFRAADSAERAFRRRKAPELRQNARAAQQRKEWALSERLWRQSLEEDPDERSSTIGLASTLVYLGKLDEATELAGRLLANWPEDENGPLIMARLAEERGDAEAAMAQWRQVLALMPTKPQALIRLGRLLIGNGEFAQAGECAERLSAVAPDNPAGGALHAEIALARGDVEGALALRKAMVVRFPLHAQILRDYGRALLDAGEFPQCAALIGQLEGIDRQNSLWLKGQYLAQTEPGAGHTGFWRETHNALPTNVDFIRKYLHAALRDGAGEDAVAAMKALLANPPLRTADANFVVGLVNVLDSAGDGDGIRRLVREFLGALKGTAAYRLAAIRLSRAIFLQFPAKRSPSPARPPSERILRMLRGSPANPSAAHFVEATAALLAELQASVPACLFDTDVSRAQCEAFVADIRAQLSSGSPYAFIRVNDGEGSAMPYEAEFARHAQADDIERETSWWGRALETPARDRLNADVLDAMTQADCLGIPTLARVLRDVRLDAPEKLGRFRSGRGLRAVLHALREDGPLRRARAARQMMTSAHIQYDLQRWNLYKELFAGVNAIVAVSCHKGLADAFDALFGATITRNILTPAEHASMGAYGMTETGTAILPEVLPQIVGQLGDDLRGHMVIVGAGYAGKIIVREARARGAVALDLGSIFDYWVGAATRSYQTTSMLPSEATAIYS